MRQSELKVRPNKQFWLAENVTGGRFLNHSTVVIFFQQRGASFLYRAEDCLLSNRSLIASSVSLLAVFFIQVAKPIVQDLYDLDFQIQN